jgi:hypothetical protein
VLQAERERKREREMEREREKGSMERRGRKEDGGD